MSLKFKFVLTAVLACIAVSSYYGAKIIYVGAAYKARLLCSGIFVSKRVPKTILDIDLSYTINPLLPIIQTQINYKKCSVRAGWLGIIERRSTFQEGYGCNLGYAENELKTNASIACPQYNPLQSVNNPVTTDTTAGHNSIIMPDNSGPIWPQKQWLHAKTPNGIAVAIDWAFTESNSQYLQHTRAVLVVYKGRIIGERYAPGITAHTPLLGWSMTKGVLNATTGIAVKKGLITVSQPVPISGWQQPQDLRSNITLDDLLHMSSGLQFDEDYNGPLGDVAQMLFLASDMAAYVVNKPLIHTPGKYFYYSSGDSMIISKILAQSVYPMYLKDFIHQELFEPLGVSTAVIEQDGTGTLIGSSNMYASARDWARLGLLYLRDGKWKERQILPVGWVQYSRTTTDPKGEYGAHVWRQIPKEYRANPDTAAPDLPADAMHFIGHYGQAVTIVPSEDLVLVRLGLSKGPDGTWDQEQFIRMVLTGLKPQPMFTTGKQ